MNSSATTLVSSSETSLTNSCAVISLANSSGRDQSGEQFRDQFGECSVTVWRTVQRPIRRTVQRPIWRKFCNSLANSSETNSANSSGRDQFGEQFRDQSANSSETSLTKQLSGGTSCCERFVKVQPPNWQPAKLSGDQFATSTMNERVGMLLVNELSYVLYFLTFVACQTVSPTSDLRTPPL